ncbi:uncharacterized protein LOC134255224 [Saccostrea cucullata]|uniref:uncharacterized protein LOC134255224 n=1 Tax=Saccostrea cuccullata TaxID=36930 RepID=UPI002ED1FDC3
MASAEVMICRFLFFLLAEIVSFSEGRRGGGRSFRGYRSSYYSSSGTSSGDQTGAYIAVGVILGLMVLIGAVIILKSKCCPYWSPSDVITDCRYKCQQCRKGENKVTIEPSSVQREKRKNTWAPVKRHMAKLRIVMHTPKPVLEKRESKNLEKKISLYESNPTHYREFMEPPPAYEYIDVKETNTNNKSDFLQNRQRISRVVSQMNLLREKTAQSRQENSMTSSDRKADDKSSPNKLVNLKDLQELTVIRKWNE